MNKKTHSKMSIRRPATFSAGLVLALSTSLLSACFGESPEQQVESAKKLLAKNDAKAAVIQLKNALQQNASLAEARFLLGKALFQSGDIPGALIELEKARKAGLNSEEMTVLTVRALLAKGEIDRVLSEFSELKLQDVAQRVELQVALANAHMVKGNTAAAAAAIESALRDDPNSGEAALARARLLAGSKDLGGALEVLEKLLQAQPKNGHAWRAKADLLAAQQADYKVVADAYRQALAIDGKDIAAHSGLIALYLRQRDAEAVGKQLEAMRAVAPKHPQTLYYGATAALEKRDLKSAEEQVQALLKLTPDNPQALYLAGMVDYQLGSYQKAAVQLGMVLQAPGNHRGVRLLLAQTYLRAGDTARAISTLEPLLAESPGVPEAYALTAEAHQQAGDAAAAQGVYAKLVKLDPKNSQGRIAVALVQIERGNAQQGLDALRALAKSEPDARADMALINALMRRREFDQALAAVDQLEQKPSDKAQAAVLRGRIQAMRGKPDKAREAYEQALKITPGYLPAATALAGMDLRDKNPDEALKRFEGVAKANPASVDARLAIVGMRAQKGASRESVLKDIEVLIKEFPKEPGPLLAQATWYLDAGQTSKAVEVAQSGRRTYPSNPAFVDLLGRAYSASNELNQAINSYGELIRLQPRSPLPLIRLAEVHAKNNDLGAAIVQLRKALSLEPGYVPAKSMLVAFLSRSGQTAEARQLAKAMQQQHPGEALGWVLEGDVEAAAKNQAAASALYKTALGKQDSTELSVKLYRSYHLQNKDKEAAAHEVAWLEKHPKDVGFMVAMGEFAMASGDMAKAVRMYRAVLQVQPDSILVLNNLAWMLNRVGDPEALQLAEKAVTLAPEAPAVLDTAAGVYSKAGKYDKAIELQRKSLKVAPDIHLHRLHLAEIYVAAGKKDEARKELAQLSGLGQGFAQQADVQRLSAQLEQGKR